MWLKSENVVKTAIKAFPDHSEFVLKPIVGSLGENVVRFRSNEGLKERKHLATLVKHRKCLLQPFCSSVKSLGERSLIFFDGKFSHAVRKEPPGNNEFKVQGGKVTLVTASESEVQIAQKALNVAENRFGNRFIFARIDLLHFKGVSVVNEMELIDPELFLSLAGPKSVSRFADSICRQLKKN